MASQTPVGLGCLFFALGISGAQRFLWDEELVLNQEPLCPCRARAKEQLAALKKRHENEISHHAKEIERLQKEIERHKQSIKKLKQSEDDD